MSHTITITRLPDEERDDAEYMIGGTCEPSCRVWRECKRKSCQRMNPDYGDERFRHGVSHMHMSEVGWAVETNECGLDYAYNLGLQVDGATTLGVYGVEVDWDGDEWVAYLDREPQDSGRADP